MKKEKRWRLLKQFQIGDSENHLLSKDSQFFLGDPLIGEFAFCHAILGDDLRDHGGW